MNSRLSQFRWRLAVIFILANIGIWLLTIDNPWWPSLTQPLQVLMQVEPGGSVTFAYILFNAGLVFILMMVDRDLRRDIREHRDLQHRYNRLQLMVSGTEPGIQIRQSDHASRITFNTSRGPNHGLT